MGSGMSNLRNSYANRRKRVLRWFTESHLNTVEMAKAENIQEHKIERILHNGLEIRRAIRSCLREKPACLET